MTLLSEEIGDLLTHLPHQILISTHRETPQNAASAGRRTDDTTLRAERTRRLRRNECGRRPANESAASRSKAESADHRHVNTAGTQQPLKITGLMTMPPRSDEEDPQIGPFSATRGLLRHPAQTVP